MDVGRPQPSVPGRIRWVVRACGAVAALVGGVYLVLWGLGLPPRWAARGVITVKTNMALAQLLGGSALLLLRGGSETALRRRVAIALSAVVLVIGAATLSEHLLGVDLGVDQLLASEPPDPLTTSPNRMGPPGALSLTLLGAALVALAWRRRLAAWLGAITCCVVLVPAVGFLYRIGELYGDARVTVIAWPTVVALLALATGVSLADPGGATVPVLWRDDPGGELLRRLLVPAIALPIAVGYLRLAGERSGLYERHVGTGIFAVTLSVLCFLMVWRGAVGASASAVERRRAEQRLRLLVEANPIGVLVKGADGRILEANDAYLRIVGRSRADLVRGRLGSRDLTPPEHVLLDDRAVEEARRGGVSSLYEKEYVRSDGQRVPVLVACAAIGGDEFVAFVLDITERKRSEEALREADRRKDEFLGMLSHELRNPLTPIRNSLHILGRVDPAGDQARRAREIAGRQVGHLARIVDDLLDVTRVARGKIELRRGPVDLVALVRATAEDHREILTQRGIRLSVAAPSAPLFVDGDDTRLAQVLGNLLHNAAKFTPSGGAVEVWVGPVDGGASASLRVRDTGAGVAPQLLDAMFEPFTQGRQTLARSEGGLGLGLALVKALVSLHGGHVTAHSDGPGHGTEFVVTLPAHGAGASGSAVGPRAPGAPPPAR